MSKCFEWQEVENDRNQFTDKIGTNTLAFRAYYMQLALGRYQKMFSQLAFVQYHLHKNIMVKKKKIDLQYFLHNFTKGYAYIFKQPPKNCGPFVW